MNAHNGRVDHLHGCIMSVSQCVNDPAPHASPPPGARIARCIPEWLHRGDSDRTWITVSMLVKLIRAGLAPAGTGRMIAGNKPMQVTCVRITDTGRRALKRA